MTAPVPILMYHAVAHRPAPAARRLSVTPEAFTAQMELLAAHRFTALTASELAHAWRTGGPLPRRPVLITFDDGFAGVHHHALPVLARLRLRATLFAVSGWLSDGTGGGAGAPDTMLDWRQARELAEAGVEIGAHSHTHPQLDQCDDATLRRELGHCRDVLTDRLGHPPVSFAYPYGYSDRRVRRAVREAGFTQALAVGNALAHPARQGPYALARLTVRRGTGIERFHRMLEGHHIARDFAVDRALTKGMAVVRRSRQLLRKVPVPRG